MIINHNLSADYANRVLGVNNQSVQKNLEKLSSGMRINSAGDDASGLAVSEKMRAQIRGLGQASRNIQDGISFIQTAEGYLEETTSILQRLRELSVQAANGIYSAEDRMQIQVEVSQMVDEVNRIAEQSEFNGLTLLTGRFSRDLAVGQPMRIQMGANMNQSEQIFIGTMSANALGLMEGNAGEGEMISLREIDSANQAIGVIDNALSKVTKQRVDLGAYQNRLDEAQKGVDISAENLQAAESRIRDADMASEMVEFTKNSILNQASIAMLSQANVRPQSVLQLL
ncbi:MAG: flagellin [Spirochaetales bacterium]|nr:flagellin [Spirochaetales bacterium]